MTVDPGDALEMMLRQQGATDGMAWFDLLLQRQARVYFEMNWMCFQFGQTGAFLEAVRQDKARAKELGEMLDAFEETISDFSQASDKVVSVLRDILANAKRNLEKVS